MDSASPVTTAAGGMRGYTMKHKPQWERRTAQRSFRFKPSTVRQLEAAAARERKNLTDFLEWSGLTMADARRAGRIRK